MMYECIVGGNIYGIIQKNEKGKTNNKKPAFVWFPFALYKKIHKVWKKESLQNE